MFKLGLLFLFGFVPNLVVANECAHKLKLLLHLSFEEGRFFRKVEIRIPEVGVFRVGSLKEVDDGGHALISEGVSGIVIILPSKESPRWRNSALEFNRIKHRNLFSHENNPGALQYVSFELIRFNDEFSEYVKEADEMNLQNLVDFQKKYLIDQTLKQYFFSEFFFLDNIFLTIDGSGIFRRLANK